MDLSPEILKYGHLKTCLNVEYYENMDFIKLWECGLTAIKSMVQKWKKNWPEYLQFQKIPTFALIMIIITIDTLLLILLCRERMKF